MPAHQRDQRRFEAIPRRVHRRAAEGEADREGRTTASCPGSGPCGLVLPGGRPRELSPTFPQLRMHHRAVERPGPVDDLSDIYLNSYEEIRPMKTPTSRFHPDRAAGGDRDHRRPDRPVAAGRAVGPRGRPPVPVRQQPQAARPGDAQLPSTSNNALPLGRTLQAGTYRPFSQQARILGFMEQTQRLQLAELQPEQLRPVERHGRGDRRSTASSARATRRPQIPAGTDPRRGSASAA